MERSTMTARRGRIVFASVLALLLAAVMLPQAVTATGNSRTPLRDCVAGNIATTGIAGVVILIPTGYYGGSKVYARNKAKGASRTFCPETWVSSIFSHPKGWVEDNNLNKRGDGFLGKLDDIWNGFNREIQSLKLIAAPGCITQWQGSRAGKKIFYRKLDNSAGVKPIKKFYEIPRKKDNTIQTAWVRVDCPEITILINGAR